MKHMERKEILTDDRLKFTVIDLNTKKLHTQGKRVARKCPMSHDEIRVYVECGPIAAIKTIRDRMGQSLIVCKNILDLHDTVTGKLFTEAKWISSCKL